MESKLNHRAIENYSDSFTAKLVEEHFQKSEWITGQEILNFFEVKQVNLFILKNLFRAWREDSQKIKSPYFDYEVEEVKSALNEFMNLLSQHIKIRKQDFELLLNKAVKDTILLIFSPYDYYQSHINDVADNIIRIKQFREEEKYVKINKPLYEELIKKIESEGQDEISTEKALTFLDEVIGKITDPPEDFEGYVASFSKFFPLDIKKIYTEEEPEAEINTTATSQETVNEKFSNDNKTLLDEIQVEKKSTIIDLHRTKKIESIKSNITINQRFMFVNELFSGKTEDFNLALEKLEACDNYDEAFKVIKDNYVKKNNWEMESDEVFEFLAILEKRFD